MGGIWICCCNMLRTLYLCSPSWSPLKLQAGCKRRHSIFFLYQKYWKIFDLPPSSVPDFSSILWFQILVLVFDKEKTPLRCCSIPSTASSIEQPSGLSFRVPTIRCPSAPSGSYFLNKFSLFKKSQAHPSWCLLSKYFSLQTSSTASRALWLEGF